MQLFSSHARSLEQGGQKCLVLSSYNILDYDAGLEVLMAKRKTGSDGGINMQDLARVGAEARLEALRAEQAALLAAFPDLRGSSSGQTRQARSSQSAAATRPAGKRRGGMSPAQRKAVGERMKAYWAARRAEKSGAASGQSAGDEGGARKTRGRKRGRRK
jgi:hypothetical protein